MSTQSGFYYDVIWESLDNSAVVTWFNSTRWPGWITPAQTQKGEEFEGHQGNRFNPYYVTSNWKIKQGKAIVAIRLRQADWNSLASLNPPVASIKIWARKDPFMPVTIADPENPTLNELYANDVFYKIARNAEARAALRFYWQRLNTDDLQNVYSRGVRFARFGEGKPDFDPEGEV